MFPELFSGSISSRKVILESIRKYVKNIQVLNFVGATKIIDSCIKKVDREKQAKRNSNEFILNQLYVIGRYLNMLVDYSSFLGLVKDHNFVESWNSLQDVQDHLRLIKNYCADYERLGLSLLERQVTTIEELYPYKIFSSAELVVSNVKCSICGKDIDSLECVHIAGELYKGEMAYGIVGKIDVVNAIALVEHPLDKRCVIQLKNSEANFSAVAYIADLMNKHKASPWNIIGVRKSTRTKKIDEFREYPISKSCPCGSGEEFSVCCSNKKIVVIPHMEILVGPAWTL